jgi:Icc-related predicted phosphoesterase
MRIVFISDTHGAKFHNNLEIPPCDVVVHSGDIGGRTNFFELNEFLTWFEKLPAKKKIFCAGNHDLILDLDWINRQADNNVISGMVAKQLYEDGQELLKKFDVVYLLNSGYEYEGIKFWGSPYSPSFHRQYWAFNADRGQEIKRHWDLIPDDTDVLITHTPLKHILDRCANDGFHAGCEELNILVNQKQFKIHTSGHIHEGYGTHWQNKTLCINASVLNVNYQLTNKPILVEIDENKKVTIINY